MTVSESARIVVEKYTNHVKQKDREGLKLDILQSLIEEALNDAWCKGRDYERL